MRLKYLYMMMVVLAVVSCSKNSGEPQGFDTWGPYAGVWVESTMKKDTINFNVSKSLLDQLPTRLPSNAGVFVMGSQIYRATDGSYKSPGGIFAYYQKNDSLYIYNFYVNSTYAGYKFQVKPSENTISIGRFYDRPELPEILSFYRIR